MLDRLNMDLTDGVLVYRRLADLIKLEQQWRELETVAQGAHLFQSYEWCRLALNNAPKDQLENIFVVAIAREGQLDALLPLKLMRKGRRKILTGLAEPFQEFTDILVRPGADIYDLYAKLAPVLNESGADYIHLGQVRADSRLFQVVDGNIPPVGEVDQSPFVNIADWPDYGTYFRSVRAQTRKNIRNSKNKLERSAPVRFNVHTSGAGISSIIDRSYEDRGRWLAEKGLTSRAFGNSDFEAFLNQFKQQNEGDLQTLGFCIDHGDKQIAEMWGVVHQNRFYAYMMGWNADYALFSPGKLLMQETVKSCFDRGLDGCEFMIPNSPYKKTWAAKAVDVQDYVLPISWLGRLYTDMWIDKVRPFAKRTVLALPPAIRRHLRGAMEAAQN